MNIFTVNTCFANVIDIKWLTSKFFFSSVQTKSRYDWHFSLELKFDTDEQNAQLRDLKWNLLNLMYERNKKKKNNWQIANSKSYNSNSSQHAVKWSINFSVNADTHVCSNRIRWISLRLFIEINLFGKMLLISIHSTYTHTVYNSTYKMHDTIIPIKAAIFIVYIR